MKVELNPSLGSTNIVFREHLKIKVLQPNLEITIGKNKKPTMKIQRGRERVTEDQEHELERHRKGGGACTPHMRQSDAWRARTCGDTDYR